MNRKKVLITRYWAGEEYKRLADKFDLDYDMDRMVSLPRAELMEKMRTADAVIAIGDKIDREMIENAPKLTAIADIWGARGVDHEACAERGIQIFTHNLGMDWLHHAETEHILMLTLAVARRIKEADAFVRAGKFVRMEQANREMLGKGLNGHTFGIVGGTKWTGAMLTKICVAFGMNVVYWDHGDKGEEMEAAGAKSVSFDELLATADFMTLVVQRKYQGGYVLDKEQFDKMKPGMIITNVTHGYMINETELVKALKDGRVGGAGLDKLEKETVAAEGLIELPNVFVTPHADGALYRERSSLMKPLVDSIISALNA